MFAGRVAFQWCSFCQLLQFTLWQPAMQDSSASMQPALALRAPSPRTENVVFLVDTKSTLSLSLSWPLTAPVLQNTRQSAFPSEGCSNTLFFWLNSHVRGEWAEIASGNSPKPERCCSRVVACAKTCTDCWVPRRGAEQCPGQARGGLALEGCSSFLDESCNPVVGSVMAAVAPVQKHHKRFCSPRCYGVEKSVARLATECWL